MGSLSKKPTAQASLPLGSVWLLEALAEAKGRQALFEHQAPQVLRALRDLAVVESAESSNRIEGVTVAANRLKPLVLGDSKPRDRPEEEIVGYRRALQWIHRDQAQIPISPKTLLRLHELAQGGTTGDAGEWKRSSNDIIEILPDGRRRIRFSPVQPEKVPMEIETLCESYRTAVNEAKLPVLVVVAYAVLDFLCIHPFRDGNGRVSRLLSLLLLYQQGYGVGRYISLEKIVEETKETYYEALEKSSKSWHQDKHDPLPWLNYFLSTLRMAYREFEKRASTKGAARGSKTSLIEHALNQTSSPFQIAQIQSACPTVGRDMIRHVLNRWRRENRLKLLGRGRDAQWVKEGTG